MTNARPTAAILPLTSAQEWRRMWPLPVTTMIGLAGCALFTYSSGLFLVPMTKEFGWSRSIFSSAFTISVVLSTVIGPFVGRGIDRIGPRRMALLGIVPFALALAAFGLANGSIPQWIGLCLVFSLCSSMVGPTTWITAVVGRFNASRGMALAVTLAGFGVASAIWPVLSAHFVQSLGWRAAWPALAATWAVPMMILTFLFLKGAPRDPVRAPVAAALVDAPPVETYKLKSFVRSRTFVALTLSGGLYAFTSLGMAIHLVPILQSKGIALTTAASIAGIAGITTLVGRIGTGVVLDHFPAKGVAILTFLIPVLPAALLMQANPSAFVAAIAVALLGFTTGAESNVITYISSRLLPRDIFASGYALIAVGLGLLSSVGPLVAAKVFDVTRSYNMFLLIIIPLTLIGTALIGLIPRIPLQRAPEPTA